MRDHDPNDGAWFEAKSHGIGAGLPIAWQGWVLMAVYFAATIGFAVLLMPTHVLAFIGITLALSILLMVIAARHTRGGWRWRWGDDDD